MSRTTALLSVTVLFVASLLLRTPFLHRPLEGEHDWLTLHTLLTVSIWNATGLQAAHHSLVMTWPNEADRFISYEGRGSVEDATGNTYFIAFPPFAFLLAFAVFKFLHLAPSAIGLKSINLAFLLPATLCLYVMLERLFPNDRALLGRWVSVLGVALFLFDRGVLLSLGDLYFPLILIVPLWIASVFMFCSIQDDTRLHFAGSVGFFALVFVMCYCDWLGFAAAGTFFLAAIFQKNFRRTNIWLAALSVVAPLAAGALTVFQYASIGGLHAFLAALTFRYQDRAGLGAQPFGDYTLWNWHTYVQIMRWYIEQHAGILLMIWGMTCLLLLSGSRLPIDTWTKRGGRLLLLFGLPVLADHLLLINHTAIHNYATLKATPLLIIVVVLLLGGAVSHMGSRAGNHELRGKSLFVRASVLTAIVCIIGSMSYIEAEKHLDPTFAKLGNSIHHFAKRDQVVFLVRSDSIDFVAPNLIYFSGRNIGLIADDQDARIFLKEHNQRHGIIFHAAKTGDLVNAPVLIEPAP